MNNFILINSTTYMKWTQSLKTQFDKLPQGEIENLNSPVSV